MELRRAAKQIFHKKTSEDLFQIVNQPPDTCPMIDSVINQLEKYNHSLNLLFGVLQSAFIEEYDECLSCDLNEFVDGFNLSLQEINILVDEKISKTELTIKELNIFRKYCEELRINGNNNKAYLWNTLNESIGTDGISFFKINKKKLNYSPNKINHQDFFLSFSSLNSEMIELNFDDLSPCPDCELFDILSNKIDLIKKLKFKDQVFNDSLFQTMKTNYENLYNWNSQIEKLSIDNSVNILVSK